MGKSSHKSSRKSSHKSRKRERPPSNDRLAAIENKLTCLIDVLAQRGARTPRSSSPASSVATSSSRQEPQDTRKESTDAVEIGLEDSSNPTGVIPNDSSTAPASQDVQGTTGVYALSGSIFGEYGRKKRHSLPRNNSIGSPGPSNRTNVTFELNSEGTPTDTPLPAGAGTEEDTLARELFAADLDKVEVLPWNELLVEQLRDLARKGLLADQRESLLKKYAPPESLTFLKAPKLNPELKSGLKSNSISKRDDFNSRDQDQVGAALCALGEAITDLLKPETQRSLVPEARSAVRKINEGAKILADLIYRLSLSRRAQILPTLNLLAKNTAENIPPDELLFGESFGEEIKKASTLEKSGKDLVRTPLVLPRKVQQPFKQHLQTVPSTSAGNSRAPATSKSSATRRSGAPPSIRRAPYRARSRSRRR